MPSVNMIAIRRADKHRLEQNTRKLVYGVVGELGLILVVVSFMLAHLLTTQTHIGVLDAQIQNLQPKVDEIKKLEAATKALTPKVQTLDTARADTVYWYTAVQNLTASLPSKTWITSVATAGAPMVGTTPSTPAAGSSSSMAANATLNVSGMSANQNEVGEAMLRMNSYPDFDQAVLSSVQKADVGTTPAVSFQLTLQLKADQSSMPAAVPQGGNNVQKS